MKLTLIAALCAVPLAFTQLHASAGGPNKSDKLKHLSGLGTYKNLGSAVAGSDCPGVLSADDMNTLFGATKRTVPLPGYQSLKAEKYSKVIISSGDKRYTASIVDYGMTDFTLRIDTPAKRAHKIAVYDSAEMRAADTNAVREDASFCKYKVFEFPADEYDGALADLQKLVPFNPDPATLSKNISDHQGLQIEGGKLIIASAAVAE